MTLIDSLAVYNTLKHEHVTPQQRQPSARTSDTQDRETLARLLAGTGVDADDAAACAAAMLDVIIRDVRRFGVLRGANTGQLRALLFSAWIDGLALGLQHHRLEEASHAD